jgi:flagellar basal body-associated protein FliL
MKKQPLIIILILVIAIGVGAYFMFFNKKDEEEEPEIILYNYAIEDAFITNVKESNKLFKTSVILVVNEKEMDVFFEENLYTIRDTILFILRDLTEEEITSIDVQDALRQNLAQALNTALDIDSIVSIKFGDFVMQ